MNCWKNSKKLSRKPHERREWGGFHFSVRSIEISAIEAKIRGARAKLGMPRP
jgi:hypothetical protein